MPNNETLQLLIQAGVGTLAILAILIMTIVAGLFVRWQIQETARRREEERGRREYDEKMLTMYGRSLTAIEGLRAEYQHSAIVGLDALQRFETTLSDQGDKTDQTLRRYFDVINGLRGEIKAVPVEVRKDLASMIEHLDLVVTNLNNVYRDLAAILRPTDGPKEPIHDSHENSR